ncbi:hypothetical protein [Streptacidiphilus sp. PAMC 29251]
MPQHAVLSRAVAACAVVSAVTAIAGCSRLGTVTHPIVKASPVRISVPSPGSSLSAMIVEGEDTVLRADLLTLSDLPPGWKHATGGARIDSHCEAVSDPAYRRLPLQAEAAFTSGSSLPSLMETLSYGTTAQVDAAWTDYVRTMASCGYLTVRLVGRTLPLLLTQVSFPRAGDATDARKAVSTAGRGATVYLVVTRKGNLLESVTYADQGTPSMSEIERIVEGAAADTDNIG